MMQMSCTASGDCNLEAPKQDEWLLIVTERLWDSIRYIGLQRRRCWKCNSEFTEVAAAVFTNVYPPRRRLSPSASLSRDNGVDDDAGETLTCPGTARGTTPDCPRAPNIAFKQTLH